MKKYLVILLSTSIFFLAACGSAASMPPSTTSATGQLSSSVAAPAFSEEERSLVTADILKKFLETNMLHIGIEDLAEEIHSGNLAATLAEDTEEAEWFYVRMMEAVYWSTENREPYTLANSSSIAIPKDIVNAYVWQWYGVDFSSVDVSAVVHFSQDELNYIMVTGFGSDISYEFANDSLEVTKDGVITYSFDAVRTFMGEPEAQFTTCVFKLQLLRENDVLFPRAVDFDVPSPEAI